MLVQCQKYQMYLKTVPNTQTIYIFVYIFEYFVTNISIKYIEYKYFSYICHFSHFKMIFSIPLYMFLHTSVFFEHQGDTISFYYFIEFHFIFLCSFYSVCYFSTLG